MSAANYSSVRMQFGDGSKIDSWLQFTLRDTYTDPLGQLDFVTAPIRTKIAEYRERLKKGQLVTVLCNDVSQGTFLITTTKQLISKKDGCIFQITCKSPLVTAQEGSVEPGLSFGGQATLTVADVVLKALFPYGFDRYVSDNVANVSALTGRAINGRGGRPNVTAIKVKDAQSKEGEKAYQFCARILSRRAIALRMAVDGTLLFTAPNYDQEAAYTLVQDFDGRTPGDRFFDGIEVTDTNDEQYSECRVRGTAPDTRGDTQSGRPKATVKTEDISATRPPYDGGTAAPYKPLILLDKQCPDAATSANVAKHALGLRSRSAFTVIGEVGGFVASTGRIWQVDTMARVVVEAAGIDEDMWILERVLTQDKPNGQRTRLTLIPKGALLLGDEPE